MAEQNNIFIIGYMGSGKTTVGKALAKKMGRTFLDMDETVEKDQNLTVNQIFMKYGEHEFRNHEAKLLDNIRDGVVKDEDGLIVSCGGGIILDDENRKVLKKQFVIWLKCNPETMYERIKNNENLPNAYFHIKDDEKRKAVFTKQYEQREDYYSQCTNLVVDSNSNDIDCIVTEIIEGLKE